MDTPPTSNPPNTPTLEDAWRRFAKYDKNAVIAQKRFIFQRKLILGLGVAAAAIAVFYSELEQLMKSSEAQLQELPEWMQWFHTQLSPHSAAFLPWLHLIVILIPIAISILVAGTVKFNMGISWVLLRSAAEAIKKEIFFYRTQIGGYQLDPARSDARDVELARQMKVISKRLMETQVNQIGLESYTGALPPNQWVEQDDGFSDLTPEQYITYRLDDQFNYYQRKSVERSNELRRFQWLIYILGGIGTLLAALRFDVWIAVVGALATAFASFLEFKRVESTIVTYNMAAADLYDIRTWWRALSPASKAQPFNIETLIKGTESVIQSENAGWLQEMRDALSKIYGMEREEGLAHRMEFPALPEVEPLSDPTPDLTPDLTANSVPDSIDRPADPLDTHPSLDASLDSGGIDTGAIDGHAPLAESESQGSPVESR